MTDKYDTLVEWIKESINHAPECPIKATCKELRMGELEVTCGKQVFIVHVREVLNKKDLHK